VPPLRGLGRLIAACLPAPYRKQIVPALWHPLRGLGPLDGTAAPVHAPYEQVSDGSVPPVQILPLLQPHMKGYTSRDEK
jgi:hypothetical protein